MSLERRAHPVGGGRKEEGAEQALPRHGLRVRGRREADVGAVERGEHRLLRGLRARVEEQLQLEDRGVAEVQRAQQLCASRPPHAPTLPLHQQGVRVQQDALVELQVLQHAALRGEPSPLPYARRQCQVLLLEVALGVHRAAVALRLSGSCSAYHQVLHETLALRLVEVLARH